ncbi:DMT family transporter [Nonomuraea sp. LPB2021202275-12-8]|uniref:DMT family transporter n=1 Tax=Nonomuraea sp. LPB2021202275-12-8 TaxID=3120159 RepID=UPI00300C02A9
MEDSGRRGHLIGAGAGTAAGLIWGLAFLLPVLLPGWSPVAVTVGRYLAYGAVSVVLFAFGGRALWRLLRRHWQVALAFAMAGNVLYYLLLVLGIQLVGAPVTDIVIGCIPVTVALAGNALYGAYRWRSLILPVTLVAAGLALVNVLELSGAAATEDRPPGLKLLGLLAVFGAVILWTWYGLANARFLTRHPDVPGAGWSTVIGLGTGAITLVGLPVAALTGQLTPSPSERTPSLAAFAVAALVLGIVVSWAATGLWNVASARLSPTAAGMLINVETVAGFTYIYVARGEWPPLGQVAGFALILIGVLQVVRLPAMESRTTGGRLRRAALL